MIRLLLAVLLVVAPAAFSRAEQDDAYGNLIGMADSAATDKGPDAGEIPAGAPKTEAPAEQAPKDAPAPAEAAEGPKPEPAPTAKPAPPVRPARKERADDDGPLVAAPAAPAPRVWTRLFASLLPPPAPVGSFEVAASTSAAPPVRPAAARAVTRASVAGSAQGLRELVATATAPGVR